MKIHALALLAAAPLLALTPGTAAQDPAAKALDDAMQKMMHGMHMQSTGDPDKDFAIMMIVHHQGAIDMAKVELEHGDDPQMRALAAEVIAAQEQEIAEMKAWLEAQE